MACLVGNLVAEGEVKWEVVIYLSYPLYILRYLCTAPRYVGVMYERRRLSDPILMSKSPLRAPLR